MNDITEEMLVAQMKLGDRQAFAELYNRYKPSLYRTACLISGNTHDGEDIMQETFIKAFVHCKELKSNKMFRYWLFRILNRTAWQLLNSNKSEMPDETVLDQADQTDNSLVEESIIRNEQYNEVYHAVMKLDYKLRLVVVLYYYNELSTKQIAQITDCYEGTVKSRLFTARKRLKKLIPES